MQLDKSVINTLAKKREVPYEVMFKISDAEQDPIKKNRYWFDYDDSNKQILLKIGCSNLCPNTVTVTDSNNQTHTCYFKISFQADNDDTIAVLGTSNVCIGTRCEYINIIFRIFLNLQESFILDLLIKLVMNNK